MRELINKETMMNIYNYGTYYNPASKHYNLGVSTNIVCDRCQKNYLDISIGWQTFDLCLSCINTISNNINKKYKAPEYSTVCMTSMAQHQFKHNNNYKTIDDNSYKTTMLQRLFRNGIL